MTPITRNAVLGYARRLQNIKARTIQVKADKRWAKRTPPSIFQKPTVTDSSSNLSSVSAEDWAWSGLQFQLLTTKAIHSSRAFILRHVNTKPLIRAWRIRTDGGQHPLVQTRGPILATKHSNLMQQRARAQPSSPTDNQGALSENTVAQAQESVEVGCFPICGSDH